MSESSVPPCKIRHAKAIRSWLFPQIDAALHHGGAGTTGASLRGTLVQVHTYLFTKILLTTCGVRVAGIPTLIKPWFGDQFFWAARVQKLGAGLKVPSLSSSEIAHALVKATSDRCVPSLFARW